MINNILDKIYMKLINFYDTNVIVNRYYRSINIHIGFFNGHSVVDVNYIFKALITALSYFAQLPSNQYLSLELYIRE